MSHLVRVLEGVRVIELAHMIAGPACGQILSDLGAEVVKIEPPAGDITRHIGPRAGSESALFACANRGKQSVFLDLRDPLDAERARALVETADVVICNIDASMVARAGLDAPSLRVGRPRLIYVDITGFGVGQPSGTDGLAQASMGLMSVTGAPDGECFRTGASIVDVSTAVWGALAVLAAILEQRRSGEGSHLQTSLGDVCLYMQMPHVAMHAVDPAVVRRNGNHSMVSCTPMLRASDGRVMVTLMHNRHWHAFCDAAGAENGLRCDARFSDPESRSAAQTDIEREFAPLFSSRSRSEWLEKLSACGLPCAAERDYEEVLADDRLWSTGALQRHGPHLQLGLPLLADGARLGRPAGVPSAADKSWPRANHSERSLK
jgi:crotonobetainyl-CoA:carnitine CoA-transferase CaiB-like acyl-CoA transferase